MKKALKNQTSLTSSGFYLTSQQGTVLLLALLVMFAMTLAGLIISLVVLGQIKISRNLVDYNQAYYAAYSGLEKSLYKIKIARAGEEETLANTIGEINNFKDTESFLNGAEFSKMIAGIYQSNFGQEDVFPLVRILPNQSIQYNFYNPDNPTEAMQIEYFWPFWADGCEGVSTIELSIYKVSDILLGEEELAEKVIYDCGGIDQEMGSNLCLVSLPSLVNNNVVPPASLTAIPHALESYIVRVKSIRKDAAMLADCPVYFRLFALDEFNLEEAFGGPEGGNGLVDYINQHSIDDPNIIELEAFGRAGNSEVSLRAILPWVVPVSGLSDFVLFSQSTIEKIITK